MRVKFTVNGKPIGKGRPRFVSRGKFVQTYTPEATANYETLVKLAYRQDELPKLEGPLRAEITAYFPIPKSTSKKKTAEMALETTPYTHKPDTDNLIKAILDALNGIAFDDDSQVTDITAYKRYGATPRVEVALEEMEGNNA